MSVKKNPNFYVFLGKKYLETHETIELHALGNAVSTSVIASENLVRYVPFSAILLSKIRLYPPVQPLHPNQVPPSYLAPDFL